MSVPVSLEEISGAAALHDWFGYWPNFHDAEILSLHLNRSGTSVLRVHTWEMTNKLDEKGYYVLEKHTIVEFDLETVHDLSLNGFSQQNVIFELGIEKIDSGFRVTPQDCYGLAGTLDVCKISIRVIPGKPS